MNHQENLNRVQVLRGPDTPMQTVFYPWVAAIADHLEDVLTRHAPEPGDPPECSWCIHGVIGSRQYIADWPCADYASALRLLDALDGGAP